MLALACSLSACSFHRPSTRTGYPGTQIYQNERPISTPVVDRTEQTISRRIQRTVASVNQSKIETPKIQQQRIPSYLLQYTGFHVSYNEEAKVPNWVAYELTSKEAQSQTWPRDKNFYQDPDCTLCQADYSDYRNSGWTKGHMAPAGDMKWDSLAMHSSCFYTNICPQAARLNNGGWKSLEETCRNWATQYGRIWIACGPIFSDTKNTIGYNEVWVPDYFFKVILLKIGEDYYCGGYIFTNSEQYTRTICTVDEVENITNIDFFPLLEDSIEDVIEANLNKSIFR
ncbi:MAG: DNA/RNA non-specific endonuclease [Bacteroidales bacterium]|nr:DNA/RNA non-specific endonuclease [Bacteroidales bacterium]